MPGHPIFAALYERVFISGPEKAGLRQMREQLLSAARGRVLELGAGTGLNLPHYGAAVSEVVLTEPDPHMAKRLRERASRLEIPHEVVEAGAERIPYPDDSFDTVVATLVFCTVEDPAQAVQEAARVLRPEGELLLIEHVRAPEGSRRARWQDRLQRPWTRIGAGCHPNRDTSAALRPSFEVSGLEQDDFPGPMTGLVKPLIRGRARPLGAG